MTKRRPPGTFADAVTRIAGDLGWDGAAQALGRSASLLRKAADPDAEFQLSLDQALALDLHYVDRTGLAPPLVGAYQAQIETALARRGLGHEDPMHRVAQVMRAVGTLAADLSAAVSQGHVSPGDAHRLFSDIADHRREFEQLVVDVEDLTKKPARG